MDYYKKTMKKEKYISVPQAPTLRAVQNPYSVQFHVFVNGILGERLLTITKFYPYKRVRVNWLRLAFWLKKGLKVDPALEAYINKLLKSK